MIGNSRILVVDADPLARALLRDPLHLEGFDVTEVGEFDDLQNEAVGDHIDLMTLEFHHAGRDGFELFRSLRNNYDFPIVIVTDRTDPIDRIIGLELGADDYITKPFNAREAVARVRAVLRRARKIRAAENDEAAPPSRATKITFDSWIFDLVRRELHSSTGQVQSLTSAEFELLSIFVRAPQQVLSRDDLAAQLTGREHLPFSRSIDNLVSHLRKKIEVNPKMPQFFKSVRCIGYVFTGSIQSA